MKDPEDIFALVETQIDYRESVESNIRRINTWTLAARLVLSAHGVGRLVASDMAGGILFVYFRLGVTNYGRQYRGFEDGCVSRCFITPKSAVT